MAYPFGIATFLSSGTQMEICETQICFRSLFLLLKWFFFSPHIVSEKQLLKIKGNSPIMCLNQIISDTEDEKYT